MGSYLTEDLDSRAVQAVQDALDSGWEALDVVPSLFRHWHSLSKPTRRTIHAMIAQAITADGPNLIRHFDEFELAQWRPVLTWE